MGVIQFSVRSEQLGLLYGVIEVTVWGEQIGLL
jgi:hypothetical protein